MNLQKQKTIWRCFLLFLVLVNFCRGEEEFIYLPESITYAGMTIECTKGCGIYDDSNLLKIWSILESAVNKIFCPRLFAGYSKEKKGGLFPVSIWRQTKTTAWFSSYALESRVVLCGLTPPCCHPFNC